jgi:hypothetical protein
MKEWPEVSQLPRQHAAWNLFATSRLGQKVDPGATVILAFRESQLGIHLALTFPECVDPGHLPHAEVTAIGDLPLFAWSRTDDATSRTSDARLGETDEGGRLISLLQPLERNWSVSRRRCERRPSVDRLTTGEN